MRNYLTDFIFEEMMRWDFPIKNEHNYCVKREDGKTILSIVALGIDKNDVTVDIEDHDGYNALVINGKTGDYSISYTFNLDINKYSNVEWEANNGILTIELFHKERQKPQISIKQK